MHAGAAGDAARLATGPRESALVIRRRIAAMQLVACRMAHERVQWDQGRTVRRSGHGEPDVVLRVPLCGAPTRTLRLACGHTMARSEMQRALVELRAAGTLSAEQCAVLAAELDALGNDIQLLDHRKGDAEKHHALLLEAQPPGGNADWRPLQEAETHLRSLEDEHTRHVVRLRVWRDRLLAAIDAAVGDAVDAPGRPDATGQRDAGS